MDAISRRIARLPESIGWIGCVGCALIVSALVLATQLSVPARGENDALGSEVEQLEQQLRSKPSSAILPESNIRQQLDAFLGSLPRQDDINNQLNALHELASRHRLALKNGEYRTVAGRGGRVNRLQIAVKTECSYADLRRFLEEMPKILPAISLNRLSMSRQKLSDTTLETVAEFALFYTRNEP